MRKEENPFDAFANNILKDLGKQDTDKNNYSQDSELDLDKFLDENFPKNAQGYLKSRFGNAMAAPENPVVSQLDEELNNLMKQYEKSATQLNLKDFQKQVNFWELKVQETKLSQEEREMLLTQSSMAKHFSQLWL
jgi:hypothetical protein